jgi:hypothetical protein
MHKNTIYAKKYLAKNYNNIEKIVIGADFGKNDANVLCEGVLIKENFLENKYTFVIIGGYYFKNPRVKKDKLDFIAIREKLEE